jgi:hypothetical protein
LELHQAQKYNIFLCSKNVGPKFHTRAIKNTYGQLKGKLMILFQEKGATDLITGIEESATRRQLTCF